MIRFRTADLTRVISRERCECGRTHLRIAPITGRIDDMIIVNGVNFFPKQVEQTLMNIPGVGSNYQIIVEEVNGVKDVRVNVEAGAGDYRVHGGEGSEVGSGLLAAGGRLLHRRAAQDEGEGPEGVS